MKILQGMDTP